jgi:ribose-phosphate pyrophosphokinase
MSELAIFSGRSNPKLTQNICDYVGVDMGKATISNFPDGETMVKIEENVRGKDCFVVQSTNDPVNQNIMELLIFIDCLKRASANSINVVIPYYGYARQDRKTEGRTPITAKMVADLITTLGAKRILTIDIHARQIEGFFNIPVDHLQAFPVFVDYFKNRDLDNYVVLSPDVGNMKTADLYAQELNLELTVIDKKRINGEKTVARKLMGDVKDKHVLMFDDMISTAGTICEAAKKAKKEGAKSIAVTATHGLFSGVAYQRMPESEIDEVIVSDTVARTKSIYYPEIKVISIAKLLGEAIIRIHDNRSVSVLLESNYENCM